MRFVRQKCKYRCVPHKALRSSLKTIHWIVFYALVRISPTYFRRVKTKEDANLHPLLFWRRRRESLDSERVSLLAGASASLERGFVQQSCVQYNCTNPPSKTKKDTIKVSIFWRRRRDSLDSERVSLLVGASASLEREFVQQSCVQCNCTNPPSKTKKDTIKVSIFWRRRRDSNPRNAFDAYTISSRAPSTRLGDFSIKLCQRLSL